jgi:hypothetical protein
MRDLISNRSFLWAHVAKNVRSQLTPYTDWDELRYNPACSIPDLIFFIKLSRSVKRPKKNHDLSAIRDLSLEHRNQIFGLDDDLFVSNSSKS